MPKITTTIICQLFKTNVHIFFTVTGTFINLLKEIINLFISNNPNNAQLICTSHQPLLLDGTNPNRDQVWIFHKDEFGKCKLNRLSDDSNSRLQSNLSKRIIDGAMGCNPDMFFTKIE